MQIIANFSYAGTSKYVSHAVENNRTLCGMIVDELIDRVGQEWDYVYEENYLGRERPHTANDVGCLKCRRLLTQRAADGCKAGQHLVLSGSNKCIVCGERVNRRR